MARERSGELTTTDRGVLRWTAEGNDGCIARVNFPAPSLKSKIEGEGKAIEKIEQLAGAVFRRLFIPTITFKPIENFRGEARALLVKAEANKLIKLCQSESAPRVGFETTERTAVIARNQEDTTMLYKNNIGPPQVRRKRYALGWSQSTFAAKLQVAGLDISRSGVSKIEARPRYVDDKSIMFLAEVLKAPVQELFPPRAADKRLSDFMAQLETTPVLSRRSRRLRAQCHLTSRANPARHFLLNQMGTPHKSLSAATPSDPPSRRNCVAG